MKKLKLLYLYKGCTKYGFQTEINYMYQELTNLYYDFINSNNRLFMIIIIYHLILI